MTKATESRHKTAASHAYLRLLGLTAVDTPTLLKHIRKGLSFSSWKIFLHDTALPVLSLTRMVQISPSTLARRKREGRLQPDESDRLVRAARVYAQALALFSGDEDAARHWLQSPQLALGGSTPLEYASTEVGAREVEALIGRLEHGIPS
jgi:putative toxin-antitoxin system antitoxin component (TIGR02293 family)